MRKKQLIDLIQWVWIKAKGIHYQLSDDDTECMLHEFFDEHKIEPFTENEQISKNELREFLKKSKRDRYGEVEHPAQILSYLKIEFDL